MGEILLVNACVRGQESRTQKLAYRYIKQQFPKGSYEIHELKLDQMDMRNLTQEQLLQRTEWMSAGDYAHQSFDLAKEFAKADLIVFAAPYWDLSFPASVKTYIENISVNGIAFRYNERGVPEGLCAAGRMIYITTAGGIIGENNFGYEYLKGVCHMFGIEQSECVSAEGLDIVGNDVEQIIEDVLDE